MQTHFSERQSLQCRVVQVCFYMLKILESNAAGLVLRPALKTGFSEMGWGSTPLLSAKTTPR